MSRTIAQARAPWRMRPRTRKAVLVAHIVTAGAWIGLDVMLGVLVFTPLLTTDPAVVALCYQVMPLLYRPILLSALACLATGVVLGVGTHHGLVRHWWVLVKLTLNILLTSLVVVLLGPALSDAAEVGRQLAAGATVDIATSNLVFPPIVSGTALVVATVLAVYKPWGRVRATR